jgi:hypothetical protein
VSLIQQSRTRNPKVRRGRSERRRFELNCNRFQRIIRVFCFSVI